MKAVTKYSCAISIALGSTTALLSASGVAQTWESLPDFKTSGSTGHAAVSDHTDFRHADSRLHISAAMGTRTGNLDWSIAGNADDGPNVLSELSYRNVIFTEFESHLSYQFDRGILEDILLVGKFKTGTAGSGNITDSDFAGDDRTEEYSRSQSDAEGSSTRDFEAILGYRIRLTDNLNIVPMIAAGKHWQTMVMKNGQQIIDTENPNRLGPFRSALDSQYAAQWTGGWLGGQLDWARQSHHLSLQVQIHKTDFYAEANWNLRSDFAQPKSFAHWADGHGFSTQLMYHYQFSERFKASVKVFNERWNTSTGKDVVFYRDGSTAATRLNGVNWDSSGYTLGLQFLL